MMRLTEDEIDSIKYLVQKYSDLWIKSEECTKRLSILNGERDSLVKEIEKLAYEMDISKKEEKILDEKLTNKYGNIQLDIETFEFTKLDK